MKTIIFTILAVAAIAWMTWDRGLWGDKGGSYCEQTGEDTYSCPNDHETMCEMGVVQRFEVCTNKYPPKEHDVCEKWMEAALKICRS